MSVAGLVFKRRVATLGARIARSRHGLILCYHGVEVNAPSNAGSAHVSRRQFAETLGVACEVAQPVPLRELIARNAAGKSTAGLFAVTSDDAYASLADSAVTDILDRNRIPLTVFVVAKASVAAKTFWWDETEEYYPRVSAARWAAFEQAIGLPDRYRASDPVFGPLRPLRQWILHEHAGRWPADRDALMHQLRIDAGSPALQRAMSFDELTRFAAGRQIDIGVHTQSHPVLSLLKDEEVRSELVGSLATLREHFPDALPWVAVPFGLYDDRTSRLAREAGLEGMLNLHAVTMAHASPVHGLPRVNIMERMPSWKLAVRLGASASLLPDERRSVQFPPNPGDD